MSDYELYHASTRKHKYIKKIGNRYFYTQEELRAYLQGDKGPVKVGKIQDYSKVTGIDKDGKPIGAKTIGARLYYDKNKTGGYNKSIGAYAEKGKVTLQTTDKDYTADLSKTKKTIDKKRKQVRDVKEAVAEATGRRDVYWEAPKVTENGHTFYDDEASTLRTGKMDKKGKVRYFEKDGVKYKEVVTDHDTEQYENHYTKQANEETRARGKKKLKKMATKPVRTMKKQVSKGKRALDRWKKKGEPKVTVVQSISEDKNYKRQNGQRG